MEKRRRRILDLNITRKRRAESLLYYVIEILILRMNRIQYLILTYILTTNRVLGTFNFTFTVESAAVLAVDSCFIDPTISQLRKIITFMTSQVENKTSCSNSSHH